MAAPARSTSSSCGSLDAGRCGAGGSRGEHRGEHQDPPAQPPLWGPVFGGIHRAGVQVGYPVACPRLLLLAAIGVQCADEEVGMAANLISRKLAFLSCLQEGGLISLTELLLPTEAFAVRSISPGSSPSANSPAIHAETASTLPAGRRRRGSS